MDMFLLVDLRFIDAPIRYHSKVEDLSSSLAEMESVFTLSLKAFKSEKCSTTCLRQIGWRSAS